METKPNFLRSLRIAIKGMFRGLFYERNSRIQLFVATVVIGFSAFLNITTLEYLLVIFLCFLVILLELINTSIEKLLDVIYPEYNPEIGMVKDIMSGVVLLGALLSIVVGFVILTKPTIALATYLFSLWGIN